MTPRTSKLRQKSLDTRPSISHERAVLLTDFYQMNYGRYSTPVMRAKAFYHLCKHKTVYIGEEELIVGERGPKPKNCPTYPELTCHRVEDLEILNSRPKATYQVEQETLRIYREKIIPYWHGRSMRDHIFEQMSEEWKEAYEAGIFTEFMEQRAPGHTVLDGKIYRKGMLDFIADIQNVREKLDLEADPEGLNKLEALKSFEISCNALILFAERHAALASELANEEKSPERKMELELIAKTCLRVPANAPRTFFEALQYYWFCHLAVITELNGWDSFSPGRLDQHLWPFYERELKAGTLTPEKARELLECFFIKFNNHPAPPKVGVTAEESGTYTDFANINLGGLLPDGKDGVNELSYMLLDIIEEMHLLQPSSNIQLSARNPDRFLKRALRVLAKGYGFPSIFNADAVVQEQLRQGKSLEDAREGGCSGCVEVGAFGKEAYILTGYFNMPKLLELALHEGIDRRTGKRVGPNTGKVTDFNDFEDIFEAWKNQFDHFLKIKFRGNMIIEQLYANQMPAPFLSVLTDDCISKGKDYNSGGARYNNSYVQFVGLGTITDSLSAIKQMVYEEQSLLLPSLLHALDENFEGELDEQPQEVLRQRLLNHAAKYGNNNEQADEMMKRVFNHCVESVDGVPNAKGGSYRAEMLPTTCHVYFGSVTSATPDGRKAGRPLSEGISPVQGADRNGPTSVIQSAAKMDHLKTGGTLLNMKLTPSLVGDENGIDQWASLVRSYFRLDGHHIQFNVVSAQSLREALEDPEKYRGLIVRVAGYSDYFCDLSKDLQQEIISRTEHKAF
ncbi:MAG: glycyl radical protein [Verrucomicrobiae bacterium]|nr:glycyl radical protein [Verrucomicrobiae bacterium]